MTLMFNWKVYTFMEMIEAKRMLQKWVNKISYGTDVWNKKQIHRRGRDKFFWILHEKILSVGKVSPRLYSTHVPCILSSICTCKNYKCNYLYYSSLFPLPLPSTCTWNVLCTLRICTVEFRLYKLVIQLKFKWQELILFKNNRGARLDRTLTFSWKKKRKYIYAHIKFYTNRVE